MLLPLCAGLGLRPVSALPQRMCLRAHATNSSVLNEYLSRILNARVYDIAHESPLQSATNLSKLTSCNVMLKREDTQPVFSFKLRGAYNKIVRLSEDQLRRGVVACSAGNHAQGVAISASRLGINATIVMPVATPAIKVNAVRHFGGESTTVKLHGNNYDEAAAEAKRLVGESGLTLIHPFNDADVIAGQGTIGMEILKARNGHPLDAIFVCCGGGGMLAGVSAYVKSIRPSTMVIGVEADDAAGMTSSLQAGKVVTLDHVGLFADGAAVRTVGDITFDICNRFVDDMITVNTDEICAAIKLGFNDTRCVLEPAGALAIAGLKKYAQQKGWKGKSCVAISSGANMDFDRLRFVSERADSTEVLLAVDIPERPGSFRELYSQIFPRNVTEFSYRIHDQNTAHIIISFQAMSGVDQIEDKQSVVSRLIQKNYRVHDLTGNEMAKAHARHLAGGRAPYVTNEVLCRFEFPESPGALHRFLGALSDGGDWNVSLFHYRNHGADFGRVLVGIQVDPGQSDRFSAFLNNLGYTYYSETNNVAYKTFLL